MERDGAGQEWKERACLTSDEFPRGHRRAPIVHARYGGEIRVYRRAADRIRGIRSPSLLRSHTGGGGERGIRKNSITIIVRCDIDSISLEDFRLDFIRTIAKGSSEPTRTAFLPSGGAASPAMAALLSLPLLFRPRERERGGGSLGTFRDELERKRGSVSFFRGNVDAFRKRGSTGCSSLGSTWQMGGEDPADSCRGWRGDVEKGKGASWEREEGKARERLSRRFVATCPLPSAGTRVCTHDTVKLPRQKQLPYRPTVRATNPGQ